MIEAILTIPYAVALALLGAEIAGKPALRRLRTPAIAPAYWICAILVTYAIQLAIVRYGATHANPLPAWRLAMPLPVVFLYSRGSDAIEAALLGCGLLQSYALLALYRSKPSTAAIVTGAAVLIVASLLEPALTSGDLYTNVAYAMLGPRGVYSPPAQPFGLAYRAINDWWGTPIPAAPYGAFWIEAATSVTMFVPGLLAKMIALRVLGAISFVAFAVALRSLGLPRRFAVVAILNPALAMQFVVNGHNDLFGVLFVLGAAAAARQGRMWAAATMLVIAGLVKLPLAIVGLPVLSALGNSARWKPWVSAAAALAVVAAISWSLGGAAYFNALVAHVGEIHSPPVWHFVAAGIALVVLVSALAGLRRRRAAVWLLPPLGGFFPTFIYPWYLAWGIPYALSKHRVLGYLLVWFPFVASLIDQQATRVWTLLFVFPLAFVFALSFDYGAEVT